MLLSAAFTGCQRAPEADVAIINSPQVGPRFPKGELYKLSVEDSKLSWIGTKPTGRHHGTFQLDSGSIYVQDGMITGGQLFINMRSMKNLDLRNDLAMHTKFETELKGENFFDVSRYPTAQFEITNVQTLNPDASKPSVRLKGATHLISGNFTLKNVTKNISFPARIRITHQTLTAAANFNFDRTQWGITYRADKSLQDKMINPMVNIDVQIVAHQ